MTVQIRVANLPSVKRKLERLGKRMRKAAAQAAEDMTFEESSRAKRRATIRPRRRTRRYWSSIHPEVRKVGGVSGKIASNVVYAPALEFGTKPHVIRPRRKKALFWPGAAHPVKSVRHPGTPAFNVLGDAAQSVARQADRFINRAIRRNFC